MQMAASNNQQRSAGQFVRRPVVGLAALLAISALSYPLAESSEAGRPRRFIYNSDASNMFVDKTPPMSPTDLHSYVDEVSGSQITTFFVCPNYCMPVTFPSKVTDMLGGTLSGDQWAEIKARASQPDHAGTLDRSIANLRGLIEAGHDPVKVVIGRARAKNMEVFITFRMNEIHDVQNPDSLLVSTTWRHHPEWRVGQPTDKLEKVFADIIGGTPEKPDQAMTGRFLGDPYVAACCPQCGALNPDTTIRGIGAQAVRCRECGAEATPFTIAHGYTVAFDHEGQTGVTVNKTAAERIAQNTGFYAAMPEKSIQNSILAFAPHDLVGVPVRLRPFLGQLGTTPAIRMPDSHNAGDFGVFLIDAPHALKLTGEQLELRTDGHMDIDAVRAGAVVICPVKTPGGGVYLGDMHAMQGDGEIAGHTCDVAGTARLGVQLIKGLALDGPILLPNLEDLPYLARPFTAEELANAKVLAGKYGISEIERSAPLSFVGTGANLNAATENGLKRASDLLGMSMDEVKNRTTISGGIEIGRHPGVVQVTFLTPLEILERLGLRSLVCDHYRIS